MGNKTVAMAVLGGGVLILVAYGGYLYTAPSSGPAPEGKGGSGATAGPGGTLTFPGQAPAPGSLPYSGYLTAPLPGQSFAGLPSASLAVPGPAGPRDLQLEKKRVEEQRKKRREEFERKNAKLIEELRKRREKRDAAGAGTAGTEGGAKGTAQVKKRVPDASIRQQFPDIAVVPKERVTGLEK